MVRRPGELSRSPTQVARETFVRMFTSSARRTRRPFPHGFFTWRGFFVLLLQVSEVEMRGMLALEMELSVEEILVYRDVAR